MKHSEWTGMVSVDDTALAVSDSSGEGRPVVYLNGSFASQRHWRRTIGELGDGFRHITFDERARGRSKRSSDYSFAACLRDLDAVLQSRKVRNPILVGWSYGAFLATSWGERHPGQVTGVVNVDGALPYGLTGAASRERIEKTFRRTRMLLPLIAPFGLAARMTAAEHAAINIELNELASSFGPILDRVGCPVRYVLGSGDSFGANSGEHDDARAALTPHLGRNPNLQISATVASSHGKILRNDFRAVAQAVRDVAAVDGVVTG